MEEYLLQMKNVSKRFGGVQALSGVQLNVRAGEVHALMGENGAGKSTLMKCLFGLYVMDEGEIILKGKSVHFMNPNEALKSGVAMVQQELEQVQESSVMDNIWLGRFPMKGPFIDDKKLYADTKKLLEDFNIHLDPKMKISQLSVSMKQMVDIVKAVSYHSSIIVLDEPTSSLTEKETEALFEVIERLKTRGCGIIYISHKMDEVLRISDMVTIMRDGQWIGSESTKDMDVDTLIRMMVAREMNDRFPPKTPHIGEVTLKVENLSTVYEPRIEGVSLEARRGEVLGIAGLVGAGRTELLESIFGLRKIASGKVFIHGKEYDYKRPPKEVGLTLLTEERRATGIFPLLDIRWNTVASSIEKTRNRFGFVSNRIVEAKTQQSIDSMHIKTESMRTLISNLSGGNQQKVLLGRCLLNEPEILLLDEPTRGIDVGAKYEIYQLILRLAEQGKTVLFVSSEMQELMGVADRIMVMSGGRNAGIIDASEATQEHIMSMAAKYVK